jgi:hypothetical protein
LFQLIESTRLSQIESKCFVTAALRLCELNTTAAARAICEQQDSAILFEQQTGQREPDAELSGLRPTRKGNY